MSPSSSRAEPDPFGFLTARGPAAEATSAGAWLQALLEAEVALARAHAAVGSVPAAWADAVAAAAVAERYDLGALLDAAADGGNIVIALLPALRAAAGDAAPAVHRGATSQDIVDTAAMLVVGRAGAGVVADLARAGATVDAIGAASGTLPVVGRTLLQHAVPTTLANTTQRWADGLHAARTELTRLAATLPVQLGGPVGDPAAFDGAWPALAAAMADQLGLVVPPRPWHTQRAPIAAVAGAWGLAAAAVATVALDIVLLAQDDVGVVVERAPGTGGSSSMPHKRNPIAAVSARAAALQVPGLASTLLHCAGGHELERAAGAWHAEWPALRALLRATGSAASWLAESLDRLAVPATGGAEVHQ